MSTLENCGGLLRKLVLISALLSGAEIATVAPPSTLPYPADADLWLMTGAATGSPGVMPNEADVLRAGAELRTARRLIESDDLHGNSGFDEYLQALERALDAFEASAQGGSNIRQLASSLTLARASFQESADTVAVWTKIAARVSPDASFVKVPARFIQHGQLDLTQEPLLTPEDVTAWLDLDAVGI